MVHDSHGGPMSVIGCTLLIYTGCPRELVTLFVHSINFHEPRAHLQVATVWVGGYVTTFCYLSLCEPISA